MSSTPDAQSLVDAVLDDPVAVLHGTSRAAEELIALGPLSLPVIQRTLQGRWTSRSHAKDVLEAFGLIRQRIHEGHANGEANRAPHRALIHWSPAQVQRGLPDVVRIIDPSWGDASKEGWSLVVVFDHAPSSGGSPSPAQVHFLVDDAPHEILGPGATLTLFERQTGQRARVEVLD